MSGQQQLARQLIDRARDDVNAADALVDVAAVSDAILGFHAQHAVEKALKAVLSVGGVGLTVHARPRTARGLGGPRWYRHSGRPRGRSQALALRCSSALRRRQRGHGGSRHGIALGAPRLGLGDTDAGGLGGLKWAPRQRMENGAA